MLSCSRRADRQTDSWARVLMESTGGKAPFHSLKGTSLFSIRSAFQRGLAATLWETDLNTGTAVLLA